jgi:hypothetical protein
VVQARVCKTLDTGSIPVAASNFCNGCTTVAVAVVTSVVTVWSQRARGSVGAVEEVDRVRNNVDLSTYVAAIGSVAGYAVVAVVCWVGAGVLTRMPR